MLVTLLLANSSFALEILAHDSHDHNSHNGGMVMADMQGDTEPMEEQTSENCFCDEICCLSSINLAGTESKVQAVESTNIKVGRIDHYQSIFLDPYLEPPTT